MERGQAAWIRSRPTIAMVAEQAGVAASTVSRVLNGGYASIEVKQRVTRAIEALSYSPSNNARSLKLGRSGSIGVVVETTQGRGSRTCSAASRRSSARRR